MLPNAEFVLSVSLGEEESCKFRETWGRRAQSISALVAAVASDKQMVDRVSPALTKFLQEYDAIQTQKQAAVSTLRHGRSNFTTYPDTRASGSR
jgi:hypothetical protein